MARTIVYTTGISFRGSRDENTAGTADWRCAAAGMPVPVRARVAGPGAGRAAPGVPEVQKPELGPAEAGNWEKLSRMNHIAEDESIRRVIPVGFLSCDRSRVDLDIRAGIRQ